jgi:hypothetical protein
MILATIKRYCGESGDARGCVGYVFVVRKMMSKWVIGDQKLYDVALRWCEIWGSVGDLRPESIMMLWWEIWGSVGDLRPESIMMLWWENGERAGQCPTRTLKMGENRKWTGEETRMVGK